jgi:hypothetical protein
MVFANAFVLIDLLGVIRKTKIKKASDRGMQQMSVTQITKFLLLKSLSK